MCVNSWNLRKKENAIKGRKNAYFFLNVHNRCVKFYIIKSAYIKMHNKKKNFV